MVIDTSAVVAILFGEPEAEALAEAIARDPVRLMSCGSLLEAGIVIESEQGEAGARELELLLVTSKVEVVPFNDEQLTLAREGYRRFGKGRHPAGLNFGDCFAWALSVSSGEPLLFKGNDFARADISAVAWPRPGSPRKDA